MSYLKKNQPIFVVTAYEETKTTVDFRVVCAFLTMEDAMACLNGQYSDYADSGYEMYSYGFEGIGKNKFVCRMARGDERDPDTGELDVTMATDYVDIIAQPCGLKV